jgi:DNA-binding SARP family transcriptional activator/WD40 repeat protein
MRIAVLGPLEVRADDGSPLVVPGAKERLLLAALTASAPGVVSADRLVDTLWDGGPPPTARKSLQAHLVRLRSALEPDRPRGSSGRYVVRRGPGYALILARDDVDAHLLGDLTARARAATGDPGEAERLLTAALDLWRGEPYADWPDAEFAAAERRRLAEVRASALAALLEARLAQGRSGEVVAGLERLVTEEPLREHWWRLLMLALYREGRQADALAAGRRARTVLADELGADPGPGLREMEAAILAQDPSLELSPAGRTVAPPPAGGRALPAERCPYMGLAAYQAVDARLFCGRERLIAALTGRLVDAPVMVVSGPSGAGKSSVVRAGLLPALAAGAVSGSEDWRPVLVTPGLRPVDALAALTGESPPAAPAVLVCDQAEQLWAAGVDAAERTAFLDTVLGLIDDGIVVRCVVVLRGDHVGRLAEHAAFAERLSGALVLVPPLTDPELREVVQEPARAVGLCVEPELLDAVAADVLGRAGALPLLSTALVGTWERRRDATLTLAGYLAAGGVAGALARSAEETYAALDTGAQQVARRLLVRLADVDDAGTLVRRPLPLVELDQPADLASRRRSVVEAFVARRLLSVDGDAVEVTHEALFTAWPRLAGWLAEDSAARAVRRHLGPAAREWEARGRPEDELYRGARLAAALDWAAGPHGDPTPLEQAFLDASRERAEAELREAREQVRRERRGRARTRRLAAGLAAVLVVALVATVLAVRFQQASAERATEAERSARVADANRLATLSTTAGSLDTSLLLAVQGVRLARTPDAEDGLLGGLVTVQRALGTVPLAPAIRDGVLAGAGTLFMDDGIHLSAWSTQAMREPPRRVGTWGGWTVADGSPARDDLVAAGTDIYDRMWVRLLSADGVTRSLVDAGALPGRPIGVSFTADGARVLLLSTPGEPAASAALPWRLTEIDIASGGHRDTGVTGVFRGGGGPVTVDLAGDGRSGVVFDAAAAPRAAVLVSLTDGGQVPLQLRRRTVPTTGFRSLPSGAVQMWADGTMTLYGADGRPMQDPDTGGGAVVDVAVAPDGTWAAAVGDDGLITLWNVAPTGWTRRDAFPMHSGDVLALEISSDGRRLLTVGADRLILWDATAGGGFGTALDAAGDRALADRPQVVEAGRLIVAPTVPVGGGAGGVAATFFDPRTGRVVADVPLDALDPDVVPGALAAAVSRNHRMVAVTDGRATVVLDATTREQIGAPTVLPATGDVDADGRPLPAGEVGCLIWAPDSSRLLLCVHRTGINQRLGALAAVDPSTGKVGESLSYPDAFDAIAGSPDGRQLVASSGTDNSVYFLDARGGVESVQLTDRPDAAVDIAFSPDRRRVVIVGAEGNLYVFTTAGAAAQTVAFHRDLLQAEWLPDSRTVAVTSSDGTVALYDVDRHRLRAAPMSATGDGRPAPVYLVPEPSGELVALSGERPGRRWSLDPTDWIRQACAIAGRDLTRAEWEQYLPDRAYRPTCSGLR